MKIVISLQSPNSSMTHASKKKIKIKIKIKKNANRNSEQITCDAQPRPLGPSEGQKYPPYVPHQETPRQNNTSRSTRVSLRGLANAGLDSQRSLHVIHPSFNTIESSLGPAPDLPGVGPWPGFLSLGQSSRYPTPLPTFPLSSLPRLMQGHQNATIFGLCHAWQAEVRKRQL
jgi:hypothetical protein